MFTLPSSFIANFKIGDNVHYNLDVLKILYACYDDLSPSDRRFLDKPITVTLVSICEALIFDFIDRSKAFTQEGVAGLKEANLEKLRKAKAWSMDQKIRLIKELNLLESKDSDVYVELENLAKLRNRIHIQNEKKNFEADEGKAFTYSRRLKAEKMVELLMIRFAELYPRPVHIVKSQYVDDFELPWKSHIGAL
jgi:hypothetical protein